MVLDAACGTGKYWPMLLGAGLRVMGVDQSQAMLDVATRKHPEDWPVVLDGFASVLRAGSPAYLTLELPEDDITIDAEAESAPLLEGEVLEGGAYHFYPAINAARAWLIKHGFAVWSETEGDGYHHFLLTRR